MRLPSVDVNKSKYEKYSQFWTTKYLQFSIGIVFSTDVSVHVISHSGLRCKFFSTFYFDNQWLLTTPNCTTIKITFLSFEFTIAPVSELLIFCRKVLIAYFTMDWNFFETIFTLVLIYRIGSNSLNFLSQI